MTAIDLAEAVSQLRQLAAIADELGAVRSAAEARSMAERADEGRFFVACLGQFKRGKSTLLNALLGAPVLPTGVVPVTSVVTTLRYGDAIGARIHFDDGRVDVVDASRLREYVTETGNPHNQKRVAAAEVCYPNALLATGLCLVDTPGVGSTDMAAEVTRRFVPQIDAALLVLGGDPPVSGEELKLLEAVHAETDRLIVVINKADKLSDVELVEVEIFTKSALIEVLGRVPDSLLLVSASERLGGNPTRDWRYLEQALTSLGAGAKRALLEARLLHASGRMAMELKHAVDEARQALEAPLDASTKRLHSLKQWTHDVEQSSSDLGVLLAAEQQSVTRKISADATGQLQAVKSRAQKELQKVLDSLAEQGRAHLRRHALSATARVARRIVRDELQIIERSTASAYKESTGRFIQLTNHHLRTLAAIEHPLAELPQIDLSAELSGKRRFYFTEMMTLTTRAPWQVLIDFLSSSDGYRRRVMARAAAYLTRLLETNTSRVLNDLDERLVESRRTLEAEIRNRLAALVESAERAITRAREARSSGAQAVLLERERLDRLSTQMASLIASRQKAVEIP